MNKKRYSHNNDIIYGNNDLHIYMKIDKHKKLIPELICSDKIIENHIFISKKNNIQPYISKKKMEILTQDFITQRIKYHRPYDEQPEICQDNNYYQDYNNFSYSQHSFIHSPSTSSFSQSQSLPFRPLNLNDLNSARYYFESPKQQYNQSLGPHSNRSYNLSNTNHYNSISLNDSYNNKENIFFKSPTKLLSISNIPNHNSIPNNYSISNKSYFIGIFGSNNYEYIKDLPLNNEDELDKFLQKKIFMFKHGHRKRFLLKIDEDKGRYIRKGIFKKHVLKTSTSDYNININLNTTLNNAFVGNTGITLGSALNKECINKSLMTNDNDFYKEIVDYSPVKFPSMQDWLNSAGISQYYDKFISAGYDNFEFLLLQMNSKYALNNDDIMTICRIENENHRKFILARLEKDLDMALKINLEEVEFGYDFLKTDRPVCEACTIF